MSTSCFFAHQLLLYVDAGPAVCRGRYHVKTRRGKIHWNQRKCVCIVYCVLCNESDMFFASSLMVGALFATYALRNFGAIPPHNDTTIRPIRPIIQGSLLL